MKLDMVKLWIFVDCVAKKKSDWDEGYFWDKSLGICWKRKRNELAKQQFPRQKRFAKKVRILFLNHTYYISNLYFRPMRKICCRPIFDIVPPFSYLRSSLYGYILVENVVAILPS